MSAPVDRELGHREMRICGDAHQPSGRRPSMCEKTKNCSVFRRTVTMCCLTGRCRKSGEDPDVEMEAVPALSEERQLSALE